MVEVDAKKATEIVTHYLESIYGNLNMTLFRVEDVRENGDKTMYLVLCSLITSLGSSKRTYYYFKVDITKEKIIRIHKGYKNTETENIDWEKINTPPADEEETR